MANDKVIIAEGHLLIVEDEKKALTEKVVMLSNLLRVANDSMTSAEMRLVGTEERATATEELWKAAEAQAASALSSVLAAGRGRRGSGKASLS